MQRRRFRKRSNTPAFVTRKQLKRENHLIESGQRFNPSIHPPDFFSIPWFNLIVRIDGFTNISIGVSSGATAVPDTLKAQLNLPSTTFIEYRIQNIRIWGPIVPMNSSAALSPLRASFWSLIHGASSVTGTGYAILQDLTAYPDQVSRASLGFTWPKAQQAIPIQQQQQGFLVSLTQGGGAGNVAYVKVLWRPRPAFQELLSSFDDLSIPE